jgi:hypothetical protein
METDVDVTTAVATTLTPTATYEDIAANGMGSGGQDKCGTFAQETPARGAEIVATEKLRSFCAKIIKTLAPPILKEIEMATKARSETEPFTPKRFTRASLAHPSSATASKKASTAETILLKALGIAPDNLTVDERHFKNSAIYLTLQSASDSYVQWP